jgi:cytochrome b involved in lipid metabolism
VVYDIAAFASSHPGGSSVLFEYGGRDATEAFVNATHPYDDVWQQMRTMRVGRLQRRLAPLHREPEPQAAPPP